MTQQSDCARFVALQDRKLADEGGLSPDEEAFLEDHAQQCPSCGLEAATLSVLRLTGDTAPDPALSDSVVFRRVDAVLDREAAPRPASDRGRRWAVGMGLSATAAAAAIIGILTLRPTADSALVGPSSPPRSPRLVLVSGEVTVGGESALVGQPLAPPGQLRVGAGRAVLALADGSTMELEAQSQAQVAAPSGAAPVIRLRRGHALFRIAPQPPGRRLRVVTGWGEVRVVGTVFRVSARKPRGVQVAEGSVRVHRPSTAPLALRGGQTLLTTTGVQPLADPTRRSLLRRAAAMARLAVQGAAFLTVSTRRPGARVVLEDAVVGETPLSLCVPPGTHRITASRDGHRPAERTVRLHAGQRESLSLSLEALAVASSTQPPAPPPDPAASNGEPMPRRPQPTTTRTPKPNGMKVAVPDLEEPTAGQLLRQAAHHRAKGNWRGVVRVYRQLITLHPRSSEAATSLVLIAQVLLRHLGQPRAALLHFGTYLQRYPAGALAQEAAWGQITCLRRLGRKQQEARACQKLLRLYPRSVYAKRVRARLKTLLGRTP